MKTSKYSFAVEKACRSLKEGERELWMLTVRLKYLPREVAFGKMKAMVEGAKLLRAEFGK